MPWTLSHPAAVLPFRRLSPWPLDFAALVVGSMTPDIGYYIGNFALADLAHTLRGTFVACVPTGVVMLFILYVFSRPVCHSFPEPHRTSLQPLCPNFPKGPMAWCIALLSLLIGAWTHNFWDAFTHRHGWFAERIPWLQQPVITISSATFHVALLLQHLSTIVGFAIILIVYERWLRRHRFRQGRCALRVIPGVIFFGSPSLLWRWRSPSRSYPLRHRGVIPWPSFYRLRDLPRCDLRTAGGRSPGFGRPAVIYAKRPR